MNSCELTASITAIANWLACQLTQEQLELLGVSLTQLGGYPADHFNTKEHLLQMINAAQPGGVTVFGGAEGQPVLTTKLSKDYIYSFRGDSSLLG